MTAHDGIAVALDLFVLGMAASGYVAAAWSPFLLLRRISSLFRLGPTDQWWINYLLAAVALGMLHVTTYVAGTTLLGDAVTPAEMILYSGVGIALLGMAVAGIVLPALGYRWKQPGFMTDLLLLGGALWYAAITTVPPVVLRSLSLARPG